MNGIPSVSVRELSDYLASGEYSVQLVDVREAEELAIAALPQFLHLPLSASAQWAPAIEDHLDPTREVWVLCHHGVRSAQMCQWLRSRGFGQVKNIRGGIDAYSMEIDASVPAY
ncbi:MAG: rhodanese-related sulfurtransferase [Oscillatoriales cyanobacterium SM2_2_1]|nr:rhodanese-related sulfurtransferase [Oscillatoriales cyanobacterium SM2_2_1]